LGAGSVGGIKLILDAHTMTNRIDDYKKGFSSFNQHNLNLIFLLLKNNSMTT
jgi:hypothetical protein